VVGYAGPHMAEAERPTLPHPCTPTRSQPAHAAQSHPYTPLEDSPVMIAVVQQAVVNSMCKNAAADIPMKALGGKWMKQMTFRSAISNLLTGLFRFCTIYLELSVALLKNYQPKKSTKIPSLPLRFRRLVILCQRLGFGSRFWRLYVCTGMYSTWSVMHGTMTSTRIKLTVTSRLRQESYGNRHHV